MNFMWKYWYLEEGKVGMAYLENWSLMGLVYRRVIMMRGYMLWSSPGSSAGKVSTCNTGDPGLIPGLGTSAGEGIGYWLQYSWASLVAQTIKNPPAMWETWVWSLGWEVPLEKGTGYPIQYSSLENSWTEESGRLQSMGSQKVHNCAAFTFILYVILRILELILQAVRSQWNSSNFMMRSTWTKCFTYCGYYNKHLTF